MTQFHIQDSSFDAPLDIPLTEGVTVKSVPYEYKVEFAGAGSVRQNVEDLVASASDPLLLIDRHILDLYFPAGSALSRVPMLVIDATEEAKTLDTAIKAAEFLHARKATKQGMYFVVGGGVVQDIGAFSAAIYKRGMPWTFVPTTMLAQTDSCLGGKTGLNHAGTKNLMALFSAPRKVFIDTGFLKTLPHGDMLSGLGEAFRLCVTGGPLFLDALDGLLARWRDGDEAAIAEIIRCSLSVKKAVVERDEFEIDLRRSMNYGHSLGHAIESLVNFRIPHGMAVTIGMLIENEVSSLKGMLPEAERQRILDVGRPLVSAEARREIEALKLDGILDLLRNDKKTLGNSLKLVVVETIGQIRFIDLPLRDDSVELLRVAIGRLLEAL